MVVLLYVQVPMTQLLVQCGFDVIIDLRKKEHLMRGKMLRKASSVGDDCGYRRSRKGSGDRDSDYSRRPPQAPSICVPISLEQMRCWGLERPIVPMPPGESRRHIADITMNSTLRAPAAVAVINTLNATKKVNADREKIELARDRSKYV